MTVDLTEQEWQQVLGILSTAPWRDANPLLMKIGEQMRAQARTGPDIKLDANGKEIHQ